MIATAANGRPHALLPGEKRVDSVWSMTNANGSPDQWRVAGRGMMEFWSRELETPLGDAFAAWYGARTTTRQCAPNPFSGDLPQRFSDIRIPPSDAAFRPEDDSSFHADVRDPSPMNFIMFLRGAPPVRIGDIASPLTQRVLMSDLILCRGLRYPAYQEVEQTIGDCRFGYMRLMLPVADATGTVNRIYGFCRPLAGDVELFQKQMVALT
jgi:hypothetical protein